MTEYIKAPFNFVPTSDKVFYPSWADQVSHDVPFRNGQSGVIDITLTAETPFYIRNGHNTETDENIQNEFSNYTNAQGEKQFFIPATSLKGMFRNVLEIMSFGKMNVDKRLKYTTREWDNQKVYPLKDPTEQNNLECGWLKLREDGTYVIENCGKPYRINHLRIGEYLQTDKLERTFKKSNRFDLNKKQPIIENGQSVEVDPKTARFKYSLLEEYRNDLLNIDFSLDHEFCSERQETRLMKASSSDEIETKGTIVLTGQPDAWSSDSKEQRVKDKGKGKFYEFVFPNYEYDAEIPVEDLVYEQFRLAHKDSHDWNFWKNKINESEGGVPVFFRANGKKLRDFGLAFLYKLPFKYSAKELYDNTIKNKADQADQSDLADLIFGYTKVDEANNPKALKGRVQFSHAKAEGQPKYFNDCSPTKPLQTVLGSPKASYYPLYIEQKGHNGVVGKVKHLKKQVADYDTYHDKDARLSGWKRYPVKSKTKVQIPETENLAVNFCPLAKGSVFKGKIRFHNLKDEELGALLSAVSFHNNNADLFHSLGLAKSQGFGKMKVNFSLNNVRVNNLDDTTKDVSNENVFMSDFETLMNQEVEPNWVNSIQLKELFTMASDVDDRLRQTELQYMKMSMDKGENQFEEARSLGEYLDRYTSIMKGKFKIESISAEYEIIKQQKQEKQDADIKDRSCIALEKINQLIADKSFDNILNMISAIRIDIRNISKDSISRDLTQQCTALELKYNIESELSVADKLFKEKNYEDAKDKYQKIEDKYMKDASEYKNHIDDAKRECKKQLKSTSGVNWDNCNDFNKAKKIISSYLKSTQQESLPDNETEVLNGRLLQWYEIAAGNKRTKKEFTKPATWKKIAEWVGPDKAQEWHDEIIKE